jgi:Lrp/AsnC family transcriptional regulator for asnA, asnC and gidA
VPRTDLNPEGDLDEIDLKILKILQADGRTALSEIARRLEMGTATIHERVNSLEEDGYIREYRAVLDPELLNVNEVAFVAIRTTAGRSSEVAERLVEEADIQEIHEITGEPDLLTKVRVRERADLTALLSDIGEYDGVEGTTTNVALRSVKEENKLNLNGHE